VEKKNSTKCRKISFSLVNSEKKRLFGRVNPPGHSQGNGSRDRAYLRRQWGGSKACDIFLMNPTLDESASVEISLKKRLSKPSRAEKGATSKKGEKGCRLRLSLGKGYWVYSKTDAKEEAENRGARLVFGVGTTFGKEKDQERRKPGRPSTLSKDVESCDWRNDLRVDQKATPEGGQKSGKK